MPAIRARLSRVPNNAPLDVKLNDGRKLRGRLGSVSAESFVLRLSRSGASADETAFQRVKSVRRSRSIAAKASIGIAVGAAACIALMIWYSGNI